jgi:alkylation response protein AidB-like acyl-CoA dehydrogenase
LALASGGGPVRFGAQARTALIDDDGQVLLLAVEPGDFEPLDTIFAYPLARLSDAARARARPLGSNDPTALRRYWRIGLAAEITGAMEAGLASAVDHVTQRKQFGKPIGSFQAVQHRLAEAAVSIEAARWLTLKAAGTGAAADAALALGYAQTAARRVTYDLHQFLGAMGLTLEHPLHLWTYRLKALFQELGGGAATFRAAAEERWGEPVSGEG